VTKSVVCNERWDITVNVLPMLLSVHHSQAFSKPVVQIHALKKKSTIHKTKTNARALYLKILDKKCFLLGLSLVTYVVKTILVPQYKS
jgi:hypothetical protein